MKKSRRVSKIISGGQSGVDRSALNFSIKHTIPHGGWCPKNRWAEDGPIPSLYNLKETNEESPEHRTLKNILSSDGSLIIYKVIKDEGTLKTIKFCKQNNKTLFEIDISEKTEKEKFKSWLNSNNIKILNIAGPRESNSLGIYNKTTPLLEYLFLR